MWEQLDRLEADLLCEREGQRPSDEDQKADKALETVEKALNTAKYAITVQRGVWAQAKSWWSGGDAERAWHAVHTAEVALVANSTDLAGRLAGVHEQVAKELPATDRRLKALEQVELKVNALEQADAVKVVVRERAVVAEAMRAAFAVADDALRRVRILRNQMLVFGTLLTALNVLLGILGSVRPELVPLCVGGTPCPGGSGSAPTAFDVWIVQLFGVLGAVIAVVVLLVNSQPKLDTYRLTGYQSVVKIALGATLAVVGILGFAAGAFTTLVGQQPSLLFTALVLGYAQQIATRFLDNTAERLVSKAKTGAARSS